MNTDKVDDGDLMKVASFFANSIETAHKFAPGEWSLTSSRPHLLRLNVGKCMVLDLDHGWVRILVNELYAKKCPDVQNGSLDLEVGDEKRKDFFASAPGSRMIILPTDDRLGHHLDQIEEAHHENIRIAARSRCPYKKSHRDEAVDEISAVVGRKLPHPSYSSENTQASENILVEEGFESWRMEGAKRMFFSTRYERNAQNREDAIKLHGLTCVACGFNFEVFYGEHGAGYIHVHHLSPLADSGHEMQVKVANDLTVLCANCHGMIHRNKAGTLTLAELKDMIAKQRTTGIL